MMQYPIAIAQLPKNFADAIQIARDLGFSYLWIDSLCIIQDSDDDMKREIAKMGSIYAGACLHHLCHGCQ